MTYRVLMVGAHYWPSQRAGVQRLLRFVRLLPQFGWHPVVLTQSMSASSCATDPTAEGEHPPSTEIVRVPSWRPEAYGNPPSDTVQPSKPEISLERRSWAFKEFLRDVRDFLVATPDAYIAWTVPAIPAALRALTRYRCEVVYTTGPPHSTHWVGYAVKRLRHVPWVADFRDPWARKPWGMSRENPWGKRQWGWMERRVVQTADRVILNTERALEEFRRHYREFPAEKFVAIPNGCDPELAALVDGWRRQPANRPDSQGWRLCHAGSLYRQRDPRPLMRAISLLRARGWAVEFHQVGVCDASFQVPEFLKQLGNPGWLRVSSPVPHQQALRAMFDADGLVLIQPGTDLQVPGKLYEMMLMQKPILAWTPRAGATAELIERYRLGCVVEDSSPEALAAGLESLFQRPHEGAWEQARHDFDARSLTQRLADVFDAVKSRSSHHSGAPCNRDVASMETCRG